MKLFWRIAECLAWFAVIGLIAGVTYWIFKPYALLPFNLI
jgi:hypothetical protein